MEIFPYVLLRVGGASFELLETLNIPIDNKFIDVYERKIKLKSDICNLLFNEISKLTDSKKQNILLKIKRDLFNERNLNNLRLSEIEDELEQETIEKINIYVNTIDEIEKLSKELIAKYENELPKLRERLKLLSQDRSIQNGLVFSSQSLYKNIEEYRNHNGDYSKNVKKTEISIIKYLTRTVAKTSPFSSFNNLAMGKTSNNIEDEFLQKENKEEYKTNSRILLNNSIFAYIRNCIFKIKGFYNNFYVSPNPTITILENNYRFLINFSNVESFQKIGKNPIVEYLLSIVKENEKIKYCDFIEKIVKDEMLEASEEEINAYIYQLIELGFFEFDINISGLDAEWLEKLIEYLSSIQIESESKDIILSTLSSLNALIPDFEKADIPERLEISNRAFDKFKEMKKHLDGLLKPEEKEEQGEEKDNIEKDEKKEKRNNENEGEKEEKKAEGKKIVKNVQYYEFNLKPESIYYEDTVINGEFKINETILNDFVSDLQRLLSYFSLFEMNKDEQDNLVYFFKKKYKEDESVSMLTFYEEYISDKKEKMKKLENTKQEEEMKKKDNEENKDEKVEDNNKDDNKNGYEQEIIPDIKKRIDLQKKFFENIIKTLSEKECINDDVVKINDEIMHKALETSEIEKVDEIKSSLGFFIQFYNDYDVKDGNKIKAVVNSSFPGYGKMVSRFLPLFPDEFTEETRNWNKKNVGEVLLAENIDSGIMNYNLHPALMPYEISIPGGNFVLDSEKRILISELLIRYNKIENKLQLYDKQREKIVYAFDLGFQGYGGRSELFKFFLSFSLQSFLFVYMLVNKICEIIKAKEMMYNGNKGKVFILPRIIYNNNIIISKKEWKVPKALLPFKNQNEKESEYFSRIQKWCLDLGIPGEVFINLTSQNRLPKDKNKPKKNLTNVDYKPQYINFSNPFLVRLFEKSLDKVVENLKVSEMMPGSKQLLKINNKKFVSEFVVQNYNY